MDPPNGTERGDTQPMNDIDEVEQDEAIDPADLIAELDDEPDAEYGEDDYAEDDHEIFIGVARGGPLDGRSVESRFPKGFLLVDMENEQVWLYDRQDDGAFAMRTGSPISLADEGDDNRWRAADEDDYDILVPDMASADDEGDADDDGDADEGDEGDE
jgi:hypothetical protein